MPNTRHGGRRNLIGHLPNVTADVVSLEVVRQSQRQRRASAGTAIGRVRAIAADPHVHALGLAITAANERDHRLGGRPSSYPDWCLVMFGASIRIFGSASATARALGEPTLWSEAVKAAAPFLQNQPGLPARGPSRDHWAYFLKARITTETLADLTAMQRSLAIQRAQEVGLLNESDTHSVGAYHRDHMVGIDGKVFSSPLRTTETERRNRRTGKTRVVRQDSARQRYGEGGVEAIVWGTKFAIASVRSPIANHRVILGINHFDTTTSGGEGKIFTDLAQDLARRSTGIHGFTADGAWRGTHLAEIQTVTGCGVIAPGRQLAAPHGGITIGRQSFAAQPLPWSRRRYQRESGCSGHQIWACAGTLFEQIITSDGSSEFIELTRHQTKRDRTDRKDGTTQHQFYGRYTMPCPEAGSNHDWWEPLLPVKSDTAAKFNRSEYLRVVPTTIHRHRRLYGMRRDTESLNAQLERAFYGQRLPAWGVKNQTVIVLMAAFAENAWARQVWQDELKRQRQ